MVRRSTDEPRTALDRIAAADKKTDELSRAQGRGSTAMRDAAGNVLQMNADAPYPLLRPQGVDAAVAFDPNTNALKMVSPDTGEDRDMTVRNITSSGDVISSNGASGLNSGGLFGPSLTLSDYLFIGPDPGVFMSGGNITTSGGQVAADSGNFTGNVWANQGIFTATIWFADAQAGTATFTGTVNSPNFVTTSDARLKRNITPVDDADVDTFLAAPVQEWDHRDGVTGRHVGAMAQDMPAVAQRTRDEDGTLGVDLVTCIGLLHATVQRQQQQIEALTERVTSLESALESGSVH